MLTQSNVARQVLTALTEAGWFIVGTDVAPVPPTVDGTLNMLNDVEALRVYLRHGGEGKPQSFVWFVWQGPDATYEDADEIVSDYGMRLDTVLRPLLDKINQQLYR